MSQVLLGQSYYLHFDPKLWKAMQPYPPLGTLYAASYLRQQGYEPALFDAMLADSEAEWAQALDRYQPKYAVLYEDNFNYLSKMCLLRMRTAAWTMIEMAKQHSCTVILCGADATDRAEEYLQNGADFVLQGEGELSLVELLDTLTDKTSQPFDQILGLVFLAQDGTVIRNPRRPELRDLDALPFPAWDLADIPHYRSIWLEQTGYFSINMVTTRGCPFHCNWCAKPIWGQRYHVRSPENVVAEIKQLKDEFQVQHIWFADDIFGLKPGWLERFSVLIEQGDARLPFKCLSRADLLIRPGEVEALHQAGAQTVWLGAESGSQIILDAMDKGTTVEQIRQARRLLGDAGIRACFFLQFGYPGETRSQIEETLQLVRDTAPDDIGISVSYPLPGTKFYQSVRTLMGDQQNWQDSNDLAMLFPGAYSTAFYRQLHRVVHKEFRMRNAWKTLRGSKVDVKQGIRQLARMLYNALTLFPARWQMNRLAVRLNPVLTLPHLPHEQAAMPSPQEHV